MAHLGEITRRRRELRIQSDYLRLELDASCIQLRPAAMFIEQGYHLAQALSNPHHEPWLGRILRVVGR